ncbi:MAG: glycogen debranching enzyme GlgX [Candidatus Wallbacteria bacterium HGW-Wallbacteria-1]|jgi:glycogen operon protein|uniref:Glycogen debranching enzyme GlgX n=1 Tax=Candidatus Wallbacteria bacterium HGW-Wallbacteria-1 TaxID=2013854 RepID=A0A2N1PQT9_9BACT|nr:MAG: glycogen debranching enzyme GlgX [Candidatus Wallbacteria bacterium HGW-Wallbacteria-1]
MTTYIFQERPIQIGTGRPLPLGAHIVSTGVNFSIFCRSAWRMALVLYSTGNGPREATIELDPKVNKTGDIWHIHVSGLPDPVWKNVRYGYIVQNSDDPGMNRVLMDPYARALSGGAVWGSPLFRPGLGRLALRRGVVNDSDAAYVRRCFIPEKSGDDDFDWQGDRPINRPLKDSIIYEAHVRGFSMHHSSGVEYPGTYAGIIEKIPHLKKLGITALELMPINEFDEMESHFRDPVTGAPLKNFWGYSSIAFFCPKASYAASGKMGKQVIEFKTMVRELHRAGIEVILDVVYNHTAEGNEQGPAFSFKGLDKDIYYMVNQDGTYKNYSGCGNTLNCNHPLVHDMIIDCLRYWVIEMHVDGFRFDLASILGRDEEGRVLSNPPVVDAIDEDPVLSKTKIIAEAWDAAGLYQVGKFHSWSRWAEWNGKYRDALRHFIKGDSGWAAETATRLAGSSDLYHTSGRKPYHSINYVTCHDGFTMWDLFSYSWKHNDANGENNNDGTNDNISTNCGYEGVTSDSSILKRRRKLIKNSWTILMLSQGTPLVLAGDEFGRTQKGNNNAYCQDNDISWIDWSLVSENQELFAFASNIIAFRKKHPCLRREWFFSGKSENGSHLPDVSWHGVKAWEPDFSDHSQTLAMLVSGLTEEGSGEDIYLAMNSWTKPLEFELPPARKGRKWHWKINTFKGSDGDFIRDGQEYPVKGKKVRVEAVSCVLLISM